MNLPSPTSFELKALAFADLIHSVEGGEDARAEPQDPKKSSQLPRFAIFRCVCNKTTTDEELIQCSDCKCYMHRLCVDYQPSKAPFRCPFCKLQMDGVDPFKELTSWIEKIDTEAKTIHRLVTDATGLEEQIRSIAPHYRHQPSVSQLKAQLSTQMGEISRHVDEMANL